MVYPKFFKVIRIPQLLRHLHKQSTNTNKNPFYFPYGESSFGVLREDGSFFVDKTHYLKLLEGKGKRLSLFRPPRWGKSLFASTMEAYYCALNNKKKNPAKFDTLFGDTYIGKNTTEEQGKYVVLFWDLSIDTSGDAVSTKEALYTSINGSIARCHIKYKDLLKESVEINNKDAMETFKGFADLVKRSGYPLYLIIDEYDRFANKLLFETPDAYKNMVSGKSGDPKSSVIRNVLETVKSVSSESVSREAGIRTFITGISPMAMADASGYNVCENITHDVDLAGIVGFEETDLVRALNVIFPADDNSVKKHLEIMKKWYNGYRMHPKGPLLYNTTLSLYYLKKLWGGMSNTEFDMLDENTEISTSIFELIAKNPNSNFLITGLYNGEEQSIQMQKKFRIVDLLVGIHDISRDYLLSFMYHQGVVTFAQSGKLVIPNQLVRNQFFDRVRVLLTPSIYTDVSKFLVSPSTQLFTEIVNAVTRDILEPSRDSGTFNEVSLKSVVATAFKIGTSHLIESEYDFGPKYGKHRSDLVIFSESNQPEFLLELGAVKLGQIVPESLAPLVSNETRKKLILDKTIGFDKKTKKQTFKNSSANAHFWSIEKKEAFESIIQSLSRSDLNTLKLSLNDQKPDNITTVAEYIKQKKKQLENYRKIIREKYSAEPKSYAVVNIGMQTTVCEEI